MPELALYVFFASTISFVIAASDARKRHFNNDKGLGRGVLLPATVLAPFGVLCGTLLWPVKPATRDSLIVILSVVFTLAYIAVPLLFGPK